MLTLRSIALAFAFLVACEWTSAALPSVRVIANEAGIAISIKVDGSFEVMSRDPAWQFSGNAQHPSSLLGRTV
jgi:hypothetical protein